MDLFNSIALCFSGGGYRAACFSLGTLSLFEKVGLLENVEAISTVSGGTITGVKYAQSQMEGKDFATFFKEYYQWLQKDELASNALRHLRWHLIWNKPENKHKRKNPINAFAIEYNLFTNHTTLGALQDAIAKSTSKTHLKRVVFNATDFDSTHQFRFQNIKGNKKRFGNQRAHSNYKDILNDIKLGDIIAASTAFPGGFEPIGFPSDFTPKYKELPEIGLMDGGIVDNQGASVFVSEAQNNKGKEGYDLLFLCDVSSPYPGEGFQFASKNKFSKYASWISSAYTLLLAFMATVFFFMKNWLLSYTISVVILAFLVFIHFLYFSLSKLMQQQTGIDQKLYLPPRRVGFYVLNRAKSLVRMASVVFLKNDRRQHASAAYTAFRNKVISSTVYELRCQDSNGNQTRKPEHQVNWAEISEYLGDIPDCIIENSKKSASFGTTLWFTKEDKKNGVLDSIIACGEYTACYNLLTHIIKHHGKDSYNLPLFVKLLELWNAFKEDPKFLRKQR